ncbi:hypothetical protein ACMAZD_24325 [Vibrio sp. nBUS_14]|uniref:hypothetical protein n=1 Tax=Vibrio sp. nBUS_14 TaxID=3395321 RepID=UPI003EC02A09
MPRLFRSGNIEIPYLEPEETSDALDTDEPQIEANDDSSKPSTQTELEPTLSE